MSIEVRPVGVTCNLRCAYCYEQPIRDIQPVHKYDRTKVLAQLEHVTGRWSLFGGEALIIPLPELEELLKLAHDKWGSSGVQTNGTLITPAHIELFTKYRTNVGISLDGPDELNDSRWAGTLDATRKATARTHAAIDMLLTAAKEQNNPVLIPSLIITLHAKNCSVEAWPKMRAWLMDCDRRGIRSINFHTMELDHEATKDSEWYVPHDRMKEVMLDLWELSTEFETTQITNFAEYVKRLRGADDVMCVWHSCDPWNTSAVQGLEGDGSPSHCTRTNKDGIDWIPAEGPENQGVYAPWQIGTFKDSRRYHERQLSLYVTPQEHGGCKDCRFWSMCTGHCPGTGEESHGTYGDWRLRSTYCQTWKDMLEEAERRLIDVGELPLSHHPKLKEIEHLMYRGWVENKEISLATALKIVEGKMKYEHITSGPGGQLHGDHYDANPPREVANIPHGDAHGDHVDTTIRDVPHGDHVDTGVAPVVEPVETIIPHGDHTDMLIPTTSHGDHTDDVTVPHGDHTDVVPHGDHTDMTLPVILTHQSPSRVARVIAIVRRGMAVVWAWVAKLKTLWTGPSSPPAPLPPVPVECVEGDTVPHGDHVDMVPHGDHTDVIEHGDHIDDHPSHLENLQPAWNKTLQASGSNQYRPHGDKHGDHTDVTQKTYTDPTRSAVLPDGSEKKLW